jgi:septal ring factor EnvC (AmiA/AmiB activator)
MMEQHLVTILVTLLTVLTSNAAWKFYEKRMFLKQRQEGELYRDDLRERIVKLETLLDESSKEKDKMRENIILLTTSLSRLEVEVDFLRKENEKLRAENQFLRNRP